MRNLLIVLAIIVLIVIVYCCSYSNESFRIGPWPRLAGREIRLAIIGYNYTDIPHLFYASHKIYPDQFHTDPDNLMYIYTFVTLPYGDGSNELIVETSENVKPVVMLQQPEERRLEVEPYGLDEYHRYLWKVKLE